LISLTNLRFRGFRNLNRTFAKPAVYGQFSAHFRQIFASPTHDHANDQRNRTAGDFGSGQTDRVVQMARQMMEQIDAVAAAPAAMTGEACYELGLAYASGRTQPIDLVAAHKWFNVAVMQGYHEAAQRRAELASEMTSDEIAAALREARALITRH
jgi:TPR repeat protein